MLSRWVVFIILAYQKVVSPFIPARCRYYPTCSEYAKLAIDWHGAYQGSWMTIKRLSRCHPFGGSGLDFVPLPLYRYSYTYLKSSAKIIEDRIICSSDSVSCGTLETGKGVYKDNSSYIAVINRKLKH